jgi:amino acid adenylation domain-containing protein
MVSSTLNHTAAEEDVCILPASFAQQRLWFLDQLEPGSAVYNMSAALRLTGPLHVPALQQSLDEIVRRHGALRTTFAQVEGELAQVIAPALSIALPVVDLQMLPVMEREAETAQLIAQEAEHPFDLAKGPLLRGRLLRLDEQEHMLVLTMHHIVSDAWSMGVFYQELTTLYAAFVRGKPSPLSEPPLQYADFALWQREWLQGDLLEEQLSYWKQRLADVPTVLELPIDRPRPAVQTYRGAVHRFALPTALSEALKALSRQEGATLFMTLLAAFQVLLYRYTGQDDILVGAPIANRTQAECEGLIGFFVNTLVLCTDLAGNPNFRELLRRVREVALGAYAHQDLPFERLVEELQPERDLSRNPLFQVMFDLQNAPLPALDLPDLTVQPLTVDYGTAKFDLTLSVQETAQGLNGLLEYNTDLFDEATIMRLAGHFQTLLEGITADPAQPIGTLPLLTEAERQYLLVDWNATRTDYPREMCVHQLFEAQVERTPDAVAVVFEDQQLTYRELNERANQVAHHLQRLGVGPEVLVGLCMERSLEMVVGLLGILKAGGAYVPLDPAYPQERLAFMLEDAGVPILLTQRHLLERLPDREAEVLCLDADWPEIAQQAASNAASAVTPQNLAYVIYTSGSTGRPKGAMIVHRGLTNYLSWAVQAYPVAQGRGAPVHSSISFDLTITGLFAPLLAGRATHLLPEQAGVETLTEALRCGSNFSLVKITPAHLELLAQQLTPAQATGPTRSFIIGGENLRAENVAFWRDYAPETVLVNEYGPTETVVGCCVYTISAATPRTGSIPIGRPIANTRIYILDNQLQPVPTGVPGELYIGGAGVARGYLNRPELTAEKFIADPFSTEPGARLYRTGDLARYLPDGNIEFLGRLDHQVKIRGFRIELGEIEAVLRQHPTVQEVVVLAREDAPGDRRLVAYVVPSPDVPLPSADELRQSLQQRLPAYMVPAVFVPLEALPLTPNGKVDRKVLPMPDQSRAVQGIFVAPRTPVEDLLATIWADVLQVERVGIYDNFFELGGHSLLAVRVVHRMEQVWGKKLALATLFAGPTIAQLAQALLEARDDESGVRTPVRPLQTGGSRRPFFFLHGHYLGTAYYCFRLARALGPDQPFYALDPYRLDDLAVPPTLEQIAATHLEALRAIQPEGPYLLGGFCNGGLVAYEMARQFHAQGQVVDLLVLMDPSPLPQAHRLWYRLLRGVIKCGGNLLGLGPEQQIAWFVRLRRLGQHLYDYVHDVHGKAVQDGERLGSADQRERGQRRDEVGRARSGLAALLPTDSEALHHDLGILHWSMLAYRPPSVYPGTITIFWPADEPWHARGWRPVAEVTEVEEHLVPGRESTWKTEHLPALSECLRMCLDNAHATVKAPVAGAHTND